MLSHTIEIKKIPVDVVYLRTSKTDISWNGLNYFGEDVEVEFEPIDFECKLRIELKTNGFEFDYYDFKFDFLSSNLDDVDISKFEIHNEITRTYIQEEWIDLFKKVIEIS